MFYQQNVENANWVINFIDNINICRFNVEYTAIRWKSFGCTIDQFFTANIKSIGWHRKWCYGRWHVFNIGLIVYRWFWENQTHRVRCSTILYYRRFHRNDHRSCHSANSGIDCNHNRNASTRYCHHIKQWIN